MRDFLAELRRRNVFRVGFAYIVVGWIVIEAADVLLGNFDAPDWVFQSFAILVLLGFPLALLLAWAFELTPQGLKRADQVPPAASISVQTGRRLDFIIIALLGAALAYFIVTHDWQPDIRPEKDAVPQVDSIAVLPFVNISEDPENEYFSDGLSEELISLLTNKTGLHVAGRTSSFAFKGKSEDMRAIGQKLGVKHLLEGSVRRSGDRLRITAQLTNTEDGYQLWSRTYDRTLDDLFAVQDDIAGNIVMALTGALVETGPGRTIQNDAPTRDTEAYELYLQGRYRFHKRGEDDLRASIALLEQAIALDPGFAEAHASLAAAIFVLPGYSLETYASLIGPARRHALEALELDETLSEAQVVLGAVSGMELDWITARSHYEQAVAGSPKNPIVHHWYGVHLLTTAQFEEAAEHLSAARALDPLSGVINSWRGAAYAVIGEYESAMRYRKIAVSSGYPLANFQLFMIAEAIGDMDQAEQYLAVYFERRGIDSDLAHSVVSAIQHRSEREIVVRRLDSLRSRFNIPWHLVQLYVVLGAINEAYAEADGAVDINDMIATQALWTPSMSPFRKDPRFPALIDRMNLTEYWTVFGWPTQCRPAGATVSCE